MKGLAIFAGLLGADAMKTQAKTGAIGHYAKIIKVFEDMYVDRKKELEQTESELKELKCNCDKSLGRMVEEMQESFENQAYWQGEAGAKRKLMDLTKARMTKFKADIQEYNKQINEKSAGCQSTQATFQANLQTMELQRQQVADAQVLLGQHLGKAGVSLAQGNAAAHSTAYTDADARIFTPDLKKMLGEMMLKKDIRIEPDDLKNVMGFLQAPTKKIAHAFAQVGRKKSVETNTFESVWKLLQTLKEEIDTDITEAKIDKKKHASACQNWINILQVEMDTAQAELEKNTENFDMYQAQYSDAINHMSQLQSAMDALEGDGAYSAAGGELAWDEAAGDWKTDTSNAKGDLNGCDGEVGDPGTTGAAAGVTIKCFSATDTVAWVGDSATKQAQSDAYVAVFETCTAAATANPANPTCKSCGFSLLKDADGSLIAPQRCRHKHMTCNRGKTTMEARIETLKSELENLAKAKQIMYQKEADFDKTAKFEAAMFFLQESQEQEAAPLRTDLHAGNLQPIADKMVALINSEQDKRATNAYNYNSCNLQIADLKNDHEVAQSMVATYKDKVSSYASQLAYQKNNIADMTVALNDIESAIHKLFTDHQAELKRLQTEYNQMQPLIDTVESAKTALLENGAFALGDQIILLVDRLKEDLIHEQKQIGHEQTDEVEDYNAEDMDLADQKLSMLQRRGAEQQAAATTRTNLNTAREDLATATATEQDEYEEFHQKSVECNHLLTQFDKIQRELDEHIGQLRQMLGVFSNLAKLPVPADQLHMSSQDNTYTDGNQDTSYEKPYTKVAPEGARVRNQNAAKNAAPDTPAQATASGSDTYPGNTYLGNANNPNVFSGGN